mgnify:CR=1 FL=1
MEITETHLIILCLVLLALSVAANMYWVAFGNTKKENKNDQNEKTSDAVDLYLTEQISETKKFLKGKPDESLPKLNNKVVALRTAYLNIEKKAYQNKPGSTLYWRILDDRLQKLLTVFLPQLFGREAQMKELENRINLLKERIKTISKDSPESKSNKKSITLLNDFLDHYRSSVQDQQTINKYLNKMERSVGRVEQPEYRQFFRQAKHAREYARESIGALDQLHTSLDDQLNNISNLENEVLRIKAESDEDPLNAEAQAKYERVKHELDIAKADNNKLTDYISKLKTRLLEYDKATSEREDKVSISIKSQDGNKQQVTALSDEIRDLGTEIASITDQEIGRLRDLLKRQRESITTMDSTIDEMQSALKNTKEKSEKKDSKIESLLANVRESEMCIQTLEEQIDELNNQLNIGNASADAVNEDDFDALNHELTRIKTELDEVSQENERNEEQLLFISEALEASSLEDLAAMLYQQLIDYHCEPSIEIHYQGKIVNISVTGKMEKQDRLVVKSMNINETNIDSSGRSIKFHMPHIFGIVRSSKDTAKFQARQKRILSILKATNLLIEKTGSMQLYKKHRKTLDMCQNTVKKVAYEVDKGFELHHNRTKDVITGSVGQLQDIARSAGLEQTKVDAFEDIQSEALKELEADATTRLKTRKQFLTLIQQLSDAE